MAAAPARRVLDTAGEIVRDRFKHFLAEFRHDVTPEAGSSQAATPPEVRFRATHRVSALVLPSPSIPFSPHAGVLPLKGGGDETAAIHAAARQLYGPVQF